MVPLRNAPVGCPLKVVKFSCGREAKCRLIGLGIIPGSRIVITHKLSDNGPFSVIVNGTKVVIGRGVLDRIFVEEDKEIALKVGILGFVGVGKANFISRICDKIEEIHFEACIAPILRGERIWRGKRILFDVLPSIMGDFPLAITDEIGLQLAIEGEYDFILLLANERSLERDLLLLQYLLDFHKSVVVALERNSEYLYDIKILTDLLNLNIVPVSIKRGYGFENICNILLSHSKMTNRILAISDPCLNDCVCEIVDWISIENCPLIYPPQAVALKLLETKKDVKFFFKKEQSCEKLESIIADCDAVCFEQFGMKVSEYVLAVRRAIVSGVLQKAYAPQTHLVKAVKVMLNLLIAVVLLYGFSFGLLLMADFSLNVLKFGITLGSGIISLLSFIFFVLMAFLPCVFWVYLFYNAIYETNLIYHLLFYLDGFLQGIGLSAVPLLVLIENISCPLFSKCVIANCPKIESDQIPALCETVPFAGCLAGFVVFALFFLKVFPIEQATVYMLFFTVLALGYGFLLWWLVAKLFKVRISSQRLVYLPKLRWISPVLVIKAALRYSFVYLKGLVLPVSLVSLLLYILKSYNPFLTKVMSKVAFFYRPIGLSWQEGIALLAGIFAKYLVIICEFLLRGVDAAFSWSSIGPLLLFLLFYPGCFKIYWWLRREHKLDALIYFFYAIVGAWIGVYFVHNWLRWI